MPKLAMAIGAIRNPLIAMSIMAIANFYESRPLDPFPDRTWLVTSSTVSSTQSASGDMPDHPNKHIRAALKYAESKGWTINKSGPRAHAWGVIYCPYGHETCWMSV